MMLSLLPRHSRSLLATSSKWVMPSIRAFSTTNIEANVTSSPTTTTIPTTSRIKREKPAPITVTARAVDRIKELISSNEDHIGVKIGVKRRGCNGYSYTMNYATQRDVESKTFELVREVGIYILVDPKAIFYIVGTVMDYEETELSAEFSFNNPNSKGECGCGESFTV